MKRKISNNFIDMIYNKVTPKFYNIFTYIIHKVKVKKFKNHVLRGSPSFGLLWKMSDFIKSAEEIFFYNNSIEGSDIGLYSSREYSSGQNGFKIMTHECTIVLKLYSNTKKVVLEVDRHIGTRIKNTLSFTEDRWIENPSIMDEMLLEQVIKLINGKIIDLFDYCYKLR